MKIKLNYFFKLIFLICLLICFLIFLFIYCINSKSIGLERKKCVNICQNNLEINNEIAIWTLLTDDINNYGVGAIKLLKSIKKNVKRTKFDAFVLELTNKPIPSKLRENIEHTGWRICRVNRIAPRDESGTFERFRDQFTKLLLWKAIEYTAHYYFDSDTFAIRNLDDFFTRHNKFDLNLHKIGCTLDIYAGVWTNNFNMGVFVLRPNENEYNRLIKLKNDPDFNFDVAQAEQGFLNVVYKNLWYEIGFENNANLAVYSQKRDFWDRKENLIKIIHYTMEKPWACSESYKAPCDLWKSFV